MYSLTYRICQQPYRVPVFERTYLDQESNGFPAVQQAVVVSKSKIHHRADLDLAVDGNGPLLDGVKTKNGCNALGIDQVSLPIGA